MGWGVEDDGLSVIFDKVIPDFITKKLPDVLNKFSFNNLDGYVLHSGGMKIIQAYREILNNDKTISESEAILSKFGNVSSVSVLLTLKEMIKKNYNGVYLMSALGPGFTAGLSAIKMSKNG